MEYKIKDLNIYYDICGKGRPVICKYIKILYNLFYITKISEADRKTRSYFPKTSDIIVIFLYTRFVKWYFPENESASIHIFLFLFFRFLSFKILMLLDFFFCQSDTCRNLLLNTWIISYSQSVSKGITEFCCHSCFYFKRLREKFHSFFQ